MAEHAVTTWARQPTQPGLVSVVVPVFNGAAFLGRALDSIFAQTYQTWEVVVVDDGSTDDSGGVAEACARQDERVQVVRQPNGGPGVARNRGIVECRGEFLQFLDADDELCPSKLMDQVAYLNAHPEVDIVAGQAEYFDARGRLEAMDCDPPAFSIGADLLLRNFICVNSPLTRRRALGSIGGFKSHTARGERVYGCEDWELWLRAVLGGCRLAYLSDVVVHNHWHERNVQHDRVRMLESALWALAESWRAMPGRYLPWWVLSVLEKRLALAVAKSGRGARLTRALAGDWRRLGQRIRRWARGRGAV
jgi:glycosyltransferase involved in cell wall biosynthesis